MKSVIIKENKSNSETNTVNKKSNNINKFDCYEIGTLSYIDVYDPKYACAMKPFNHYQINTKRFRDATKIFTNCPLKLAPNGTYSDGLFYIYFIDGEVVQTGDCYGL